MPSLRADIRIDTGADLTPWVWRGTEMIAFVSRETCAVDTGAMRDSHVVEFVGRNHAAIIVGMDYSSFVEFGTYKMRAQPYLGPAIQAGLPLLMQDLAAIEYDLEQGRTPPEEFRFLTDDVINAIIDDRREQIARATAEHERMMQRLGLGEPA